MRIRALLFVGIILLMLAGCGFKGNKTGSPPIPTPTPEQDVISSQIPEIKIEALYPAHMIINQSYVITVSLVSNTGSTPTLPPIEKATMVVTQPTPVGTPGATMQQAFGQGFEPYAAATLNAGSFKVLSAPSGEQSLRQPVVEWDWNVTPQSTGAQILSVDITITWEQTQSAVVLFPPKFRIGNPQLSVDVTEPATPPPSFFIFGPIDLGKLITDGIVALISTGAVTSFGIWILRRRKKNDEQSSSTTPSNPPAKDVTEDKKTP
jgi:hypothetical protein